MLRFDIIFKAYGLIMGIANATYILGCSMELSMSHPINNHNALASRFQPNLCVHDSMRILFHSYSTLSRGGSKSIV